MRASHRSQPHTQRQRGDHSLATGHLFARIGRAIAAVLIICSMQTSARADMAAEAQFEFAAGVTEANAGNFEQAVTHFYRAQNADPAASIIHYNLGLALAQLAGRELHAQCWLVTYIAGNPQSPLRPSIVRAVEDLRAAQKNNIASLIELYEQVAPLRPNLSADNQTYAHFRAGTLWLTLGDVDRAKAAAAKLPINSGQHTELNGYIKLGYVNVRSTRIPSDVSSYGPYESSDILSRLYRWYNPHSESVVTANADRARAWAARCNHEFMTQRELSDVMGYLDGLADQISAKSDFEKSHSLVAKLEGAIKLVSNVTLSHNYGSAELLNFTSPPWGALYTLLGLLVAYGLCGLAVTFDILFLNAKWTATEVSPPVFFNSLWLTILGVGIMLYAAVSAAESVPQSLPVDTAGWVGLVVGVGVAGWLLVSLFFLTCVGVRLILVKFLGASRPATETGGAA